MTRTAFIGDDKGKVSRRNAKKGIKSERTRLVA